VRLIQESAFLKKPAMNTAKANSNKWKIVILPAVAITLLAILPQINFWMKRGTQWHGTYASFHGDEFLYSAYLNALIDGRPRRTDPFTGSDLANRSLPETTFSIQMVPAFVISTFARTFGLSASSALIVIEVIGALLATVSVFWLLTSITADEKLSATGVVFVLCLGTFVAKQGLLGLLLNRDLLIFGLPFLRRYQPAASFFLFFIFSTLVWRALTAENSRSARRNSVFAGVTFCLLVFSYLYLWTAALAWLAFLALLWLLLGPRMHRLRSLGVFAIVGTIAVMALIPYLYLVSHRAPTLDSAQTLIATHRPDLLRMPEIIGICILIGLVVAWRRGKISLHDARVSFAASFALLPVVVFNQQILTGKSMQPFHFEDFIVNYVSLVSLVILIKLLWPTIPQRVMVWVTALSLLAGIIEVNLPMRAYYRADSIRDEAVPLLLRLNDLAKQEPAVGGSALVFSPRSEIMITLPTWAPQGTLLGIGSLDFGTASQSERKELFFAYLYFSGADGQHLRELFDGKTDDSFLKYYVRSAIFGHERALPSLSYHFQPIEPNEIEQAINEFQLYTQTFSHQDALRHPLTYLVTRSGDEGDQSRIDLWYQRGVAERVGDYNLYKLNLR
jgi:hypothetical protein